MLYDDDPPEPLGAIDDERLRLIFTCCHPALAMETRVALTLRMVGGLTVPEIARAFLVQETAMGQRITRAKAKIKAARIPYRVPSAEDLPARVSGVLAVLFLVFNEGYLATGPDTDPVRHELTAEAIRLTRLIRALMPDDGEVAGLLALMLLTEARRTARVSRERRTGRPRRAGPWGLGRGAGRRGPSAGARAPRPPGWLRVATRSSPRSTPCTPPPATSATPTGRRSSPSTTSSSASTPRRSSPSTGPSRSPSSTARRWRWRPSTVSRSKLAGYHAYHATRADLLRRLGRSRESRAAYDKADRAGGQHRRDRVPDPPPRPAGVVPVPIAPFGRSGRQSRPKPRATWRVEQTARCRREHDLSVVDPRNPGRVRPPRDGVRPRSRRP